VTEPAKIAGRYELDRRLGIGGMSTVQLAFDTRLERHVAIKLLAEHLADDPAFVSRFRREALSAARLVHPNVVQVFDFGFDEAAHRHFIVMEHVDGHSCAEILRERGHLPPAEAVEIVTQACRGLDYAHRNGVVHRDVKPGNLLRSGDGVVKLADFGIAKATEQSSITQVGSVLGTAAYLAPEQARGEDAGPRCDLYSLGVVSYQLLSGRLPYEAMSLSELALKQQRESPMPLDQVDPEIPSTLARAVAMALALDPESRPADALAFERALRAGARGEEPVGPTEATTRMPSTAATRVLERSSDPITAATGTLPRRQPPPQVPPRRPATARPVAARTSVAASPTDQARQQRNRRVLAVLALLALVAVVAIVAIVSTSNSGQAVQLRHIAGQDGHTVVTQLQDLIDQNTR
jgi:eukaryotic-like serine/threonine-protein kinase